MWELVYVGRSFIHSFNKSLLIAYYILSILPVLRYPFQEKKKINNNNNNKNSGKKNVLLGMGRKENIPL